MFVDLYSIYCECFVFNVREKTYVCVQVGVKLDRCYDDMVCVAVVSIAKIKWSIVV